MAVKKIYRLSPMQPINKLTTALKTILAFERRQDLAPTDRLAIIRITASEVLEDTKEDIERVLHYANEDMAAGKN